MDMNRDYASKGVAGAGLGTGIAGLALGVLNSLGGLGAAAMSAGPYNCAAACSPCSDNTPASRYELTQAKELAAKDAEIGNLKSDKRTDEKLSEVTAYLMAQIKELAGEVRKNKDEQNGINMQQVAYNATNSATIGCLQSQVAALQAMTKLVIPNTSVCPGWGDVKVSAVPASTTPAA